MSKYDKMLEVNHKQSVEKIQRAKLAIQEMIEEEDKVTVPKLMQKTGLSRGFFYKIQMVRRELDDAIHRQEEIFKNQHPVIMDKELENTMVDLKLELLRATMQNEELVKSNEQLRQQVEKLQKQLGRKEISLLKRL